MEKTLRINQMEISELEEESQAVLMKLDKLSKIVNTTLGEPDQSDLDQDEDTDTDNRPM